MRSAKSPATSVPFCSVDGCEKPGRVRGWCVGHYERWRKHGDPLAGGPLGTRQRRAAQCSIDGCTRPVHSRNLCGRHRRRALNSGSVEAAWPAGWRPPRTHAEAEEFFWANVDRRGNDECWPWTRKLTDNGYGQMWDGERPIGAHVFAHKLMVGPIPTDPDGDPFQVDHTCHEPACTQRTACPHRACCNGNHLEAVPGHVNRLRGITARPGNGRINREN